MNSKLKKTVCPICSDIVEDAVGKKKGHDSVFCDGLCQAWVHRQCGGLSKSRFSKSSSSKEPFLCPRWIICKQDDDIKELQQKVQVLESTVINIEKAVSLLSVKKSSGADYRTEESLTATSPRSSSSNHTLSSSTSSRVNSVNKNNAPYAALSASFHDSDRKFNVVVAKIPECKAGMSRNQTLF